MEIKSRYQKSLHSVAFSEIPVSVITSLQKSINRKEINPVKQDFKQLACEFYEKIKLNTYECENQRQREAQNFLNQYRIRKKSKKCTIFEFKDKAQRYFKKSLQDIQLKSNQSSARSKTLEVSSEVIKSKLNDISMQLKELKAEHVQNQLRIKNQVTNEAEIGQLTDRMFRRIADGKIGTNQYTIDILETTNGLNEKALLQIRVDEMMFEKRRSLIKLRTPRSHLIKLKKELGQSNFFNKNYY